MRDEEGEVCNIEILDSSVSFRNFSFNFPIKKGVKYAKCQEPESSPMPMIANFGSYIENLITDWHPHDKRIPTASTPPVDYETIKHGKKHFYLSSREMTCPRFSPVAAQHNTHLSRHISDQIRDMTYTFNSGYIKGNNMLQFNDNSIY